MHSCKAMSGKRIASIAIAKNNILSSVIQASPSQSSTSSASEQILDGPQTNSKTDVPQSIFIDGLKKEHDNPDLTEGTEESFNLESLFSESQNRQSE